MYRKRINTWGVQRGILLLFGLLGYGHLHGQEAATKNNFYWTALGAGPAVSGTVSGYSGINAGICTAVPYKDLSVQLDGSLTYPNTSSSIYSISSASLNIGKVFNGKHFWAGGYIGPAFIFGIKPNSGLEFKTAGLNIDIPLMVKLGSNFSFGAVPFTNSGIGYNASGVRFCLVIDGDL